MDETSLKIITAAMNLMMEQGYSATTTKDIARAAGVNECTIFRKFKGKKEMVLQAMQLKEWNPDLRPEDFARYSGQLRVDLERFAGVYMGKVTPRFVKLSIGLRTPELYEDTAPGIMAVPRVFKEGLERYFAWMAEAGKIDSDKKPEELAMMFLSMCFGFVFLRASFGSRLSGVDEETFIAGSVEVFAAGIGEVE